MVNQTQAYKNATYQLTRETKIKVSIWWNDHDWSNNNADAILTDQDFALNSISYDNQSIDGTNGNTFMLGSVYTGRFQAGFLKTASNILDITKFYKANIKVTYGIKTGSRSYDWEYVQIGSFMIYEATETDELISIVAYDATMRLDEEYNKSSEFKRTPDEIFTHVFAYLNDGYIRNNSFVNYMSPLDLANNTIKYKWDEYIYATRRELLSDLCTIMCGFITNNREPSQGEVYTDYFRFICPSYNYNPFSLFPEENRTKMISLIDNSPASGTSGLYPTKLFKSLKVKNARNTSNINDQYFYYDAVRMHAENSDILITSVEHEGQTYIAIGDYTILTTNGYLGETIEIDPSRLYTFTTKLLKYNSVNERECVAKHVYDFLVGGDPDAGGQLMTFIPLELEYFGDISIELGDTIDVKSGERIYSSLVSSINWKYKQNEIIKSPDKLYYVDDNSNQSSYQQKQINEIETKSQSFFGGVTGGNSSIINIPSSYNSGTGYEYGDINIGRGNRKVKTTNRNNTVYLTGGIQVSSDRSCTLYVKAGKTIDDTAISSTAEFSYELNEGINNIPLSVIFRDIDVNNNNIIGLFFKKSNSNASVYIPANGAKIALIGNIL